ncbi:MAG: ATP-binding protein [Clostridiales bacterium]|nr:ATP-binding protein [Clostridiales bacterium]
MREYSLAANLLSLLIELVGVIVFYRPLEKKAEQKRGIGLLILLVLLSVIYIPGISLLDYAKNYTINTLLNQCVRTVINAAAIYGYLRFSKEDQAPLGYLAGIYILIYMVVFNLRESMMPLFSGLSYVSLQCFLVISLAILEWGIVFLTSRLIPVRDMRRPGYTQWEILIVAILVELYFKWSWTAPVSVSSARPLDSIFFSICATLGVFSLVILSEREGIAQREQTRLMMEQLQSQYEMQNARRALSANTDIRQLYHDMRNHILALQSLADSGEETREYLAQLSSQFEGYESNIKTGSSVVDALLSEKLQKARLYNISFNVCVDLAPLSGVSSVDLVTMFGNAIDNAIEALQALPEGMERILYLKTVTYANMLVVRISNQYTGTLTSEDGVLQTNKKDRTLHGIGMSSIRKAVKRLGGSLQYQFENESGWFRLMLMFPL